MGLFHVGRAFESLRNSNFDTVSAIGEVIDNSLQAGAKNVRMRIEKAQPRKNKVDLISIAFGDDGKGMTTNTLEKCVQVGFSERYNDRGGIGRFGVGMTLGAVTQCTRIDVYSKPQGGNWNFIFLDLDKLKDVEDAEPEKPIQCEIPREYADLVGDTGTLVVWKNWDREDASISDIKDWIGRVYRKFIGEEIIKDDKVVPNDNQRHIFLNDGDTNEEIPSMDPLYATKTTFADERAELYKAIVMEEWVHEFDKPPDNPYGKKSIVIRVSLLPASWRPATKMGSSKENKNRRVHTNEGISILRNDREVFYGHIPYYTVPDPVHSGRGKGFHELDRYWGCEIAFDADLDHWFSVKNIKVGAKPTPELRLKIQEALNPTIQSLRKKIRDEWGRVSAEKKKATGGAASGTDDAEDMLNDGTDPPEPTQDVIDEIIKDSGAIKEKQKEDLELRLREKTLVFNKRYDVDVRGNFIDVTSVGGRIMININMNKPFFKKFFGILELLPKDVMVERPDGESEFIGKAMETNMCILLGSFVLARNDFGNMEEMRPIEEVISKLTYNWTFYLDRHVTKTLE